MTVDQPERDTSRAERFTTDYPVPLVTPPTARQDTTEKEAPDVEETTPVR